VNSHTQLLVGRAILLAGAIFLACAFFAVVLTCARATPDGQMFVKPASTVAVSADEHMAFTTGGLAVKNRDVRTRQIVEYTVDQFLALYSVSYQPGFRIRIREKLKFEPKHFYVRFISKMVVRKNVHEYVGSEKQSNKKLWLIYCLLEMKLSSD
jgi:hypothetical protein